MLDNPNLIKRFKKLSIEDQLDMAQMLNWNDRIIEVICTKSHNKKYSRIYNKIDVNMIYTYSSQNIKYKFDKNNFEITNVYDGTKFSFNLNNSEINWDKILSGKYKLKDLLSSFPNEKRNNLYSLIEFMIENYLLDFSFNKVENYKEYYNS